MKYCVRSFYHFHPNTPCSYRGITSLYGGNFPTLASISICTCMWREHVHVCPHVVQKYVNFVTLFQFDHGRNVFRRKQNPCQFLIIVD